MSEEIVLHSVFHYKPENGDSYVKIYFESLPSDVIIPKDMQEQYLGAKNLAEFALNMVNQLNNKATAPVLTYSYVVDPDKIYPKGTLIAELDTGVFKMGDGVRSYKNLGNGGTSIDDITMDNNRVAFEDGETSMMMNLNTVLGWDDDKDPTDGRTAFFHVAQSSKEESIDVGQIDMADNNCQFVDENNTEFAMGTVTGLDNDDEPAEGETASFDVDDTN